MGITRPRPDGGVIRWETADVNQVFSTQNAIFYSHLKFRLDLFTYPIFLIISVDKSKVLCLKFDKFFAKSSAVFRLNTPNFITAFLKCDWKENS